MLLPVVRSQWLSLLMVYFALGGFFIFLYGYFPLKYHGGADASWDDLPSSIGQISVDPKKLYIRNQTRVVLMIIDALRYDFVSEKYMPFTSSLITNGNACLYRAQAEPPTVTMPRIKSTIMKRDKAQWRRTVNLWRDIFAITTGTISNFIDVALNFGSSAVTEDNVINQAKLNKKNIVFYGDDTWLRLFPNAFLRSEGTTSFFVSDYTEVDLNVTRHLPEELSSTQPDWNMMILHYLGLDHIGHLEGPYSSKVFPKMLEMDNIVTMIVNATKKWNDETVIFICGDHGMKDSGSHGGASHSEITVPLVLIQNKGCTTAQPNDVDQIDIAPTLSYTLGVPFPGGNTGQILPKILNSNINMDLSSKESLYVLHYNAKMNVDALTKVLGEEETYKKECYKQYLSAVKHHIDYLDPSKSGSNKMAANLYLSALSNMSNYLTKSIVDFDMFAIILGIFIIFSTFVTQILLTVITFQSDDRKFEKLYGYVRSTKYLRMIIIVSSLFILCSIYVLVCGISQSESSLCKTNTLSVSVAGIVVTVLATNFAIIRNIRNNMNDIELWNFNAIEKFLIIGTILQPLTYGGTSFIEEEHQTWYFFWSSLTFLILAYTAKILLDYYQKKSENATEVQDKESLTARMDKTAKRLGPRWIGLMILHRFLRRLNQTGDKWAFLPDIGDWLSEDKNIEVLSLFSAASLLSTMAICQFNLQSTVLPYKTSCFLTISAALCIFYYRVTTQAIQVPFFGHIEMNEFYIIRIFWLIILTIIIIEIWSAKIYITHKTKDFKTAKNVNTSSDTSKPSYATYTSVDSVGSGILLSSAVTEVSFKMKILKSRVNTYVNVMMLICSLYLRPHNHILVPSIYLTSTIVNKILDHRFDTILLSQKENFCSKNTFCKTLFHLWIGSLFYFYQGNSNSLASVDLGSGYIGLESYIPTIVGIQTGIHTYTGPLLAGILLFKNLIKESNQWERFLVHLKESFAIIALHRMYVLLVYTIICAILRYHLFVWTVFSPKLLYEYMATFFTFCGMLTMIAFCFSAHFQEHMALTSKSKKKFEHESRNFED